MTGRQGLIECGLSTLTGVFQGIFDVCVIRFEIDSKMSMHVSYTFI